jgi:hypothetical protein
LRQRHRLAPAVNSLRLFYNVDMFKAAGLTQTDAGLRPRRWYTMGDALEDWLAHGVDGLSERTVTLYRGTIAKALNEQLGSVRLTELTVSDVRGAMATMAPPLSTRTR